MSEANFKGFRSLKANFTATPNQYFDKVVGHCHPCVERVVAILIRSTLGWEDPDTGERRLEAELALSDFVRPELSRNSARTGIAGAIEMGFLIETMPATNHAPARYALRWEDAPAQTQAIGRQRKAHGSSRRKGLPVDRPKWAKSISRGTTVVPQNNGEQAWGTTVGPPMVGRPTVVPPYNNESGKKFCSEKKRRFKNDSSSTLELSEEERARIKSGAASIRAAIEAAQKGQGK